jgi:hypothetical protein
MLPLIDRWCRGLGITAGPLRALCETLETARAFSSSLVEVLRLSREF